MKVKEINCVPASHLTKREYIAIQIMAGILSNAALKEEQPPYTMQPAEAVAKAAIIYTDCLLKELEKSSNSPK